MEPIRHRIFIASAVVSSVIAGIPLLLQKELVPLSIAHISMMLLLLVLEALGIKRPLLRLALLAWFLLASSLQLIQETSFFNPYFAWTSLLVAFTALLVGPRAAFGMAAMVGAQLILFVLFKRGDHGPFPFVGPRELYSTMLISTMLSAQVLMAFFAAIFEWQRARSEEELGNQRMAATRLARVVEIGELFQSLHRNLEPNLDIIHNSLGRLKNEEAQAPDKRHHLQRLRGSLASMLQSVHTLQDYVPSSHEASGPLMILELFQSLHQLVQSEVRLHQVQIVFSDHSNNACIQGRRHDLLQVFRALMTNSIEAMAGQNIKRILLESRREKGRLIIAVHDSGPGIPLESIDRIFKPFYSTKDSSHARGLGLALSQSILEEHGGTLSLDSNAADTCFLLNLPLAQEVPIVA